MESEQIVIKSRRVFFFKLRKGDLENGESDELLELKSELVPKLLLVQICQRIVPIGELWVLVAKGFQVLQSSHSDSEREKEVDFCEYTHR